MSPRPAAPLPRFAAALAFLLLPGLAMTASAQSSPSAERGTLLSVTGRLRWRLVGRAAAITTVTATHADTCDLSNSGGPSATVIIARVKGPVVEYLVLADSTLLIREGDRVHAITDGREAAVGRTYRSAMDSQWNGTVAHEAALGNYIRALRAHRNTKDGFWVASSDPAAAEEAITGRCPVANIATIALLSDGATRLVDRFGILTWAQVLSLTELPHGPRRLIEQTREAESSDTAGVRWPRGKVSDDASIVILKY